MTSGDEGMHPFDNLLDNNDLYALSTHKWKKWEQNVRGKKFKQNLPLK